MIVSGTPRIGHAFKEIIVPLAILFVWDVIVTLFFYLVTPNMRPIELPLPLFGSALALFLSIRDNAAYARWWEARGLWGLMINASRNIAREAIVFCDESVPGARDGIIRDIVRHQIAYVNVLRTSLRGEEMATEAGTYLPDRETAAVSAIVNKPNMILTNLGRLATEAQKTGMIDTFSRVRMETTLVDIANAQGGMERIKNTPLPAQYRFFPALFTRVFCVVLPFAIVQNLGIYTPVGSTLVGLMLLILLQIGDDLKDPFSNDIHDVPMTSMCRTVEIDLLQMIGDPAPPKIEPEDGVLW